MLYGNLTSGVCNRFYIYTYIFELCCVHSEGHRRKRCISTRLAHIIAEKMKSQLKSILNNHNNNLVTVTALFNYNKYSFWQTLLWSCFPRVILYTVVVTFGLLQPMTDHCGQMLQMTKQQLNSFWQTLLRSCFPRVIL